MSIMKKFIILSIICCLSSLLVKSQKLIRDYGNNRVTTSAISFTSDGKYMLVGGFARSYDVSRGNEDFRTIPKDTEAQDDYAYYVTVAPDNQNFLVTKVNRIEVWDLRSKTRSKIIRDNRLSERAVCYSKDGSTIFYMRKNGQIVFINSSSYSEYHSQKVAGSFPMALKAAPDGNNLLIGTKENGMIIFDIHSRDIRPGLLGKPEIEQIEFSADGVYVAAASLNGQIWLGKYPSMDPVGSWQAHVSGQTVISFHPSGKYLASGGKDKTIRIWNIPECTKFSEWEAHKYPLTSIAFSPDGVHLASGSVNDVFVRGGDDTKIWSFDAPQQYLSSVKQDKEVPVIQDKNSQLPPVDIGVQRKLALVIGNGNYLGSVLANPENDARDMKAVLQQYGFDVIGYENLNQSQMKMAMDQFGERLKNYDVGLFFYAGHGIQSKGYNYLVPVDANLRSEEQVEYDCVQADRVLGLMEASGAKVNIIILDACRNNPFERSWTRAASGKGLAYMNAPGGTLIAYATAPGSTASDGSGRNGLYTSAILESIKIPNITILQMFQNVRSIVSSSSNKEQIPWESTSLTGDFYFYQTETTP